MCANVLRASHWWFILLRFDCVLTSKTCMPHCQHPCLDLEGDVQFACGGCGAPKLCRPGSIGFGDAGANSISNAMLSLRAELAKPPKSNLSSCLRLPSSGESGALEASALWNLPYFGACRNTSCVTAHHESHDLQFVPGPPTNGSMQSLEFGEIPGQRVQPLAEIRCTSVASEIEVIRAIHASISNSTPLVLRACALDMPAVKWRDKEAYLAAADGVFATLLRTAKENKTVLTQQRVSLSPALQRDLEWATPFGQFINEFGRNALTGVDDTAADQMWVSGGAVESSLHFDTPDTLHVVVAGTKEIRLTSPEFSRHVYADFPRGSECPGQASQWGCDGLGCYVFSPVQPNAVDPTMFPAVARAFVWNAILDAGDIVLIPALWWHYIKHLPGGSIAVSFCQHRTADCALQPFAESYERHFAQHRERCEVRSEENADVTAGVP